MLEKSPMSYETYVFLVDLLEKEGNKLHAEYCIARDMFYGKSSCLLEAKEEIWKTYTQKRAQNVQRIKELRYAAAMSHSEGTKEMKEYWGLIDKN